MKNFAQIALSFLLLMAVSCGKTDYTKYVDPFIGTGGFGHTFPGACAPFGMVQPSPVTGYGEWAYCSEYVYEDSEILGFSQNHLNGTGCPDLGNVLIMPVSGELVREWNDYRSSYRKASEKASPGYYSVYLDQPQTKVEITASDRVALYRLHYDGEGKKGLLIDLQHTPSFKKEQLHTHIKDAWSEWIDEHTLVGYSKEKMWGWQEYYFAVKFNHPVIGKAVLPQLENEKALRHIAEFDLQSGEELMAKVAISSEAVEGAIENLEEIADWDFEMRHSATKAKWNEILSRVDVKGSKAQKLNFYTSLYHACIQPNVYSDKSRCYSLNCTPQQEVGEKNIYIKKNGQTYTTFSLWDTYRAAHSLYTIVTPERVNDFITSMLEQGWEQGYLPIWALYGGETHCMIGNHAIPVIAEAWRKGFRGYDGKEALELMCKTQTIPHKRNNEWGLYMQYGYYPADKISSQSVSRTLENAYDDYAVAEMAKMLGDEECRAHYAHRAEFFKNVFDLETRCARPRLADGSWQTPFEPNVMVPYKQGGSFTEATPFQYTWHIQHDVDWLIDFMGGKEEFVKRLDTLFKGEVVHNQVDITGLIGQYAHGNEPCHHIPYLYTLVGRQDRTAEVVREIFDTQYSPRYDGLCGNDDCGQMSAWYIFSSMGFYPVDPVSCKYVLGAPQIKEIVLHLHNGKTFTVKAEGLSRKAKYVDKVYLNGKLHELPYITHYDVVAGGELRFVMSDKSDNNN